MDKQNRADDILSSALFCRHTFRSDQELQFALPAGAYFCAVIVEVQHLDQTHASLHFRKHVRLFPLHLFRNGYHLGYLLVSRYDQSVVVSEYDFARMDANAAA